MKHLRFIITMATMLDLACNNATNHFGESKGTETVAHSSASSPGGSQVADSTAPSANAAGAVQPEATDSTAAMLKGISAMLGKNDSAGAGAAGIDSLMNKVQTLLGGHSGETDNPLQSVANGIASAQKEGTAGTSIAYTARYADEQPAGFHLPISGNGNTIMLQYNGGSVENGKKDGLWKNVYVSTNAANKWNIFSEAYAESSALHMKVHATSLASVSENYSININDQYKKYGKQARSDVGKNESDLDVKKIGTETLFGYTCTHVRVKYTIKGLGQTAHETEDDWYSNDVPGARYLSPIIFENHSPAVVKKIVDAGCSGVLVKTTTQASGATQLIQLSGIVKQDMPDSRFVLPPNYQEDKNTSLYSIQ